MDLSTKSFTLPDELWLKIFGYLSTTTICKVVPKVCKQWYFISNDKELWRNVKIPRTDHRLTRNSFQKLFSEKNIHSVTSFSVDGQSQFTDDMLKILISANPNLTKLSLHKCYKISSNGIKLISDLTNLHSLSISIRYDDDDDDLHSLDDAEDSLLYISERLSLLTHLSIHGLGFITGMSGKTCLAISHLQNLSHLELINVEFNETSFVEMCSNLQNVKQLIIYRPFSLNNRELYSIKFKNLSYLALSNLAVSADDALAMLLDNNSNLHFLKIMNSKIHGKFIHHNHNLKTLELIGCDHLDENFYKYFENNTGLNELNVTINANCKFNVSFKDIDRLKVFLLPFIRQDPSNFKKYEFLKSENLVELQIGIGEVYLQKNCIEIVFATCKSLLKFFIRGIDFSQSKRLKLLKNQSIREFSANWVKNVDRCVVIKLAKALPNVCSLEFLFIDCLTVQMLQIFHDHCKFLRNISSDASLKTHNAIC